MKIISKLETANIESTIDQISDQYDIAEGLPHHQWLATLRHASQLGITVQGLDQKQQMDKHILQFLGFTNDQNPTREQIQKAHDTYILNSKPLHYEVDIIYGILKFGNPQHKLNGLEANLIIALYLDSLQPMVHSQVETFYQREKKRIEKENTIGLHSIRSKELITGGAAAGAALAFLPNSYYNNSTTSPAKTITYALSEETAKLVSEALDSCNKNSKSELQAYLCETTIELPISTAEGTAVGVALALVLSLIKKRIQKIS